MSKYLLDNAIERLAKLYDFGHLLASTDPVKLFNLVSQEIVTSRSAKKVKVKNCNDCSFLYDAWWCHAPGDTDGKHIPREDSTPEDYKPPPLPDWCPLRKGSVIVELDGED